MNNISTPLFYLSYVKKSLVYSQTTINVSLTFDREQNFAEACARIVALSKKYTFSKDYLYR